MKFCLVVFFKFPCDCRHQKSKLSLKKIGRNLKKISNSTLPKSPITCEEIIEAYKNQHVKANYGMSLQNQTDEDALPSAEFFKTAYKSKGFSYVVFASQNIINSMEQIQPKKRKFLLDATFKVCPYGIYNQLLVIHVEHLSEVSIFTICFLIKYSNQSTFATFREKFTLANLVVLRIFKCPHSFLPVLFFAN